jgi:hypothetical protein
MAVKIIALCAVSILPMATLFILATTAKKSIPIAPTLLAKV